MASVRSPAAAMARCVPTSLPTMLYDCTHDNPTPYEKQCVPRAWQGARVRVCGVCLIQATPDVAGMLPTPFPSQRSYRLHSVPSAPCEGLTSCSRIIRRLCRSTASTCACRAWHRGGWVGSDIMLPGTNACPTLETR